MAESQISDLSGHGGLSAMEPIERMLAEGSSTMSLEQAERMVVDFMWRAFCDNVRRKYPTLVPTEMPEQTRLLLTAMVKDADALSPERIKTPSSEFSTFTYIEDFDFIRPEAQQELGRLMWKLYVQEFPENLWSVEEFEKEAKTNREEISETFEELQFIVLRFEDLIRRRWSKKSRAQRVQILVEAWPDIAPRHRMDVYKNLGEGLEGDDWNDEWAKCPYINVEDLAKSNAILVFLHSRGHNAPYKFAASDIEHAPVYTAPESLLPFGMTNTPDHTMALNGDHDLGPYGTIKKWDNVEDALEFRLSGSGMLLDPGLQVLEIQRSILEFLVAFCERVLHDIDVDDSNTPVQPVCLPLTDVEDEYNSIGSIITAAAYQVPGHLDIVRLKTLLYAQRNLAEDHIWSLREDPGYFADTIREYQHHSAFYSREAKSESSSCMLLRAIVMDAYYHFFSWTRVYDRIVYLQTLLPEDVGEVVRVEDLPTGTVEVFEETYVLLEATGVELIKHFSRGFHKRTWLFRPTPSGGSSLQTQNDAHRAFFIHLLMKLRDKYERDDLGVATILDELDKLLQKHPFLASELSPVAAQQLSHFSVLAECQRLLHTCQPLASRISYGSRVRRKEYIDEWMKSVKGWKSLSTIKFLDRGIAQLGNISDLKFHYPVHKPRKQEVVERLTSAEAALDSFWEAVDKYYLAKAQVTPHDLVRDMLTEGRVIYRTPPWIDAEPASRPKRHERHLSAPSFTTYQPLSADLHDETKQITGTFDKLTLSAKFKSKTRGLPSPVKQTPLPTTPSAPDNAQVDSKVFGLDKRAHKVFKILFHTESSLHQPGEIPWTDFLHAMASTGFSIEKLHGSAWQFTPTKLDVERSIQFHEPHPSSKLPFSWARRIGRRLARTYGWGGDMFRLL